jgi:hypothetical protein
MADSVIKYSDLIGADDTFDVIFENINDLKKELESLTKVLQKDLSVLNPNEEKKLETVTEMIDKLVKAKKELDRQEKKTITTRKKLADLTDQELIAREKQKIENRERVQRLKQLSILQNKEAGEIEKLRAKLSLVTIEWKKLSKEELKNGKVVKINGQEVKNLVKEKRRLTDQLKKLEKQTGDTRRNVGNYTQSLGKLGKAASAVFLGRSLVDGLRRISGFFTNIIDKNSEFNDTLGGIKDGFSSASESIQFAGSQILEFLAPAIEKVAKGIAELPFILSGVGAVIGGVFKNIGARFTFLSLDLEKIKLNIKSAFTFSAEETAEINNRLSEIREEQRDALSDVLVDFSDVSKVFNEAVEKSREEFKKFQEEKKKAEKDDERRAKSREEALKRENELLQLQQFIRQNLEQRIQAITNIQEKVANAEADLIEDQQQRLIRLEELKSKAINEQREKEFSVFVDLLEQQEERLIKFYGENADEVIKFREEANAEVLRVEEQNQQLSELQLEQSEKRKLEIRKQFAVKTLELDALTQEEIQRRRDEEVKQLEKNLGIDKKKISETQKAIIEEQDQLQQEAIEKRKKREEDLTNAIIESSQKVGQAIVDVFEKQSELSASLVQQQADAVETQRQRAEEGLSNTLKFEQDELAKRESERIKAEQKAKNAAKILALFNLVSAYAGSGDANALQRGLVDFALLTALESGLTGFEDGGFTGSDSSNKKVKGVVHANEYVVTAEDTEKFGLKNKSGSEFGEAMSDYFNQQSPLLLNTYDQQNKQFTNGIKQGNHVDFSRLELEVRAMRQAFQNQQKNDFDIENMTDYFVDIAKRVTKNRMTTITKVRKRL